MSNLCQIGSNSEQHSELNEKHNFHDHECLMFYYLGKQNLPPPNVSFGMWITLGSLFLRNRRLKLFFFFAFPITA